MNNNQVPELICVAGKNSIAVDILLYLKEKYSYNLAIICNKTETGENTFQKSLRWFAKKNGIKEYELEEVYDIKGLLFLSLEFDRLVEPSKFADARLYNIHFSDLPKYKGMYTSVHPILNGEKFAGVTLHEIDRGIDTGDIIAQRRFTISGFNCRDLYKGYIKNGTELVIENLEGLIHHDYVAKQQEARNSSYYAKDSIDFSRLHIDLNQTAERIGRQIRAYGFREYQLPSINGKQIIDYHITNIKSRSRAGKVIYSTEAFCMISTIDYDMVIYNDRFEELITACEKGDVDVVKDICSVKRHINEQELHGWTPIIVATYNNHKEIVYYLLSHGADIGCVNNNGTNLLMYAKEAYKRSKDSELFSLFYKLGLSTGAKDYYGKTVIDYLDDEGIRISGDGQLMSH